MRFLLDGQILQIPHSRDRGIGRYSINLMNALSQARPEWEWLLALRTDLPPFPGDFPANFRIEYFSPPMPAGEFMGSGHQYCEFAYGQWMNHLRVDRFLHPNVMDFGLYVPRFNSDERPLLAAIHYDLIPLLFHQTYLRDPNYFRWYGAKIRSLMQMDCLLSISVASTSDLVRLFPETGGKTHTILGAVDPAFQQLTALELQQSWGDLQISLSLDRDYLLHVGGPEPRKNLGSAVRALGVLKNEFHRDLLLVLNCALNAKEEKALRELAEESSVANDLRITGRTKDKQLAALYHKCRAFVFPSYYEGLGLPVLEAQCLGAPVAVAKNSSLPEFSSPVTEFFNAEDPSDIARAVEKIISQPRELHQQVRVEFGKFFTWAKTAELVLDGIEKQRKNGLDKKPRLVLAVPAKVFYTDEKEMVDRVCQTLGKHFQVELVTDPALVFLPRKYLESVIVLAGDELSTRHEAFPFNSILLWPGEEDYQWFTLPLELPIFQLRLIGIKTPDGWKGRKDIAGEIWLLENGDCKINSFGETPMWVGKLNNEPKCKVLSA